MHEGDDDSGITLSPLRFATGGHRPAAGLSGSRKKEGEATAGERGATSAPKIPNFFLLSFSSEGANRSHCFSVSVYLPI